MIWTDEHWDAFCALVEEAWPGDFDDHTRAAWRILLDPLGPQQAITAVPLLLLEGHHFRPSASEFLAAARRDPSRPTFAEAYQLIYAAPRGVLAARPDVLVFADAGARDAAYRAAALERAGELHPLVHSFVVRQGVERLRTLPTCDPQWGEKCRADLQREWDAHVETFDGREVAALASGERRSLGMRRFDPLAALGVPRDRPELQAGDAA